MVDVEQRALRALEQDALAGAALAIEQIEGRRHVGQDFGRDLEQFLLDRRGGRRRQAKSSPQRIVMGEQAGDLAVERFGLGEVHQADGAAADLVLVGRPDAALGGADRQRAGLDALAMRVELAVDGEDQRGVFGDLQIVGRDLDALRANRLDLARPDDRGRARRRCR